MAETDDPSRVSRFSSNVNMSTPNQASNASPRQTLGGAFSSPIYSSGSALPIPGHRSSSPSQSSLSRSGSRGAKALHFRHPAAGPAPYSPQSQSSTLSAQNSDVAVTPKLFTAIRESASKYPPVLLLKSLDKKRIMVTGSAGFLGSHLVDRLMLMGHDVLALDNFFTGNKSNNAHWVGHPNFELVRHDVVNPIMVEVDQIYHLACPASPPQYQANQIKTIKTNFLGTSNMLGLAKRTKARFLLASTSEVYGDPEVTPQKETYNGNVNQTGPRACYDEGKRVAETLTYGYLYQDQVEVRVARIFNTYGPRMNPYDGRVMSNFLMQALKGESLTIYGDGSQTRSFCYVDDLVDGLVALMNTDASESATLEPITSPVNLGSDEEFTIRQLIEEIGIVLEEIQQETGINIPQHKVEFVALPVDDPRQRRPDITRARELLNWSPKWTIRNGIKQMAISYLKSIEDGTL